MRSGWRRWLAMAFGGTAVTIVGCKSFFAPRGMPNEPLVLSRQPIESKGQVTPAQPLIHREPLPPGADLR